MRGGVTVTYRFCNPVLEVQLFLPHPGRQIPPFLILEVIYTIKRIIGIMLALFVCITSAFCAEPIVLDLDEEINVPSLMELVGSSDEETFYTFMLTCAATSYDEFEPLYLAMGYNETACQQCWDAFRLFHNIEEDSETLTLTPYPAYILYNSTNGHYYLSYKNGTSGSVAAQYSEVADMTALLASSGGGLTKTDLISVLGNTSSTIRAVYLDTTSSGDNKSITDKTVINVLSGISQTLVYQANRLNSSIFYNVGSSNLTSNGQSSSLKTGAMYTQIAFINNNLTYGFLNLNARIGASANVFSYNSGGATSYEGKTTILDFLSAISKSLANGFDELYDFQSHNHDDITGFKTAVVNAIGPLKNMRYYSGSGAIQILSNASDLMTSLFSVNYSLAYGFQDMNTSFINLDSYLKTRVMPDSNITVSWMDTGTHGIVNSSYSNLGSLIGDSFRNLQYPLQRLSFVFASDDDIQLKEDSQENMNAVHEDFLKPGSTGSASVGNIKDASSLVHGFGGSFGDLPSADKAIGFITGQFGGGGDDNVEKTGGFWGYDSASDMDSLSYPAATAQSESINHWDDMTGLEFDEEGFLITNPGNRELFELWGDS